MNGSAQRSSAGKYLLLLIALGILAGWFAWKQVQGVVGVVVPFPESTSGLIAFVREENGHANLFTVTADGTGLRQLTESPAGLRSPSWSLDGKHICYAAEPARSGVDARAFQIFIKDARSDATQLTTGSTSKDSPQWDPNGKLIAFLTGGTVKVIEPNGTNLRQVYPPPHRSTSQDNAGEENQSDDELKRPPIDSFRWAPNGVSLVFRQIIEGLESGTGRSRWWEKPDKTPTARESTMIEPESLVLLPRLEAEKPVFMAATNANLVSASWFSDSVRLAVSLTGQKGVHAIIICRADDPTGPPMARFAAQGYTISPQNVSVSPDGAQLAFEQWRMESAENRKLLGIAVIPAEGGTIAIKGPADIRKVPVRIKGEAHGPQWSPDGKRLLYWATGKSGRDIWVVNGDGSNPVNLTKGAGDNYDAVWSPAMK